jgi:hypothetical protein
MTRGLCDERKVVLYRMSGYGVLDVCTKYDKAYQRMGIISPEKKRDCT